MGIGTTDRSPVVRYRKRESLQDFDRVLVFEAGEVIIDDHPSIALPRYVQMMS